VIYSEQMVGQMFNMIFASFSQEIDETYKKRITQKY